MRSIKINSKLGQKVEKQKTEIYPYMHLINNSNDLTFQRKMGSIVSELCQLIQVKTQIKLNLWDRIKKYSQSNKAAEISEQVLQFRIFLLQAFQYLLSVNESWQVHEGSHKVIRIKSAERVKLRLVKNHENMDDQLQRQKIFQQNQKQRQIYELKKINKNLQRKILMISSQFSNIKRQYEHKIQKYKKMLTTSLLNLQIQINQQFFDEREVEYRHTPYLPMHKNHTRFTNPEDMMFYGGSQNKYSTSTKKLERGPPSPVNKLMKTPVSQSKNQLNRQLSHRVMRHT